MLKRVLVLSLFFVLATTASFASWSHQVLADIPFDFQLAGEEMPAGQYIIKPVTTDGAVVMVSHRFRLRRVFVRAQPTKQQLGSKRSEVVFHKYGDRYHLVQFRHKNTDVERVVIPTDKELWSRRSGSAAPVKIALALTPVR